MYISSNHITSLINKCFSVRLQAASPIPHHHNNTHYHHLHNTEKKEKKKKQNQMSHLSPRNFFNRRRTDAAHQPTWEPYQAQQHHTMGLTHSNPSPPFMAFPAEPAPILNSHIEFKETPEAHVYKAHLPGFKRNDVRVEVGDDRVLCIVCGKSVEKEEQREGWHCVELSSGHFIQRLTLPENSLVDHVKAFMENGILTITVPKYNKASHGRVRNINISSRP